MTMYTVNPERLASKGEDRERIANLLNRIESKTKEDSSIEAINLTKDWYTDMM